MARSRSKPEKLTPERARKRLGREIRLARRQLGKPRSFLARVTRVSNSYLARIERAERVPSAALTLSIARALDVGASVTASWFWLAIVAAGVSAEMQTFLRAEVFPRLTAGECEAISGPSVIRQAHVDRIAEHLRGALRVIETGTAEEAARSQGLMDEADIARQHLIAVDGLIDGFPGPTEELRRRAMERWYAEVHPVTRRQIAGERYVWHATPAPCGRTIASVERRTENRRGVRGKRIAPAAWRLLLDLQFGPARRNIITACRIVEREAPRRGWLCELSVDTLRRRVGDLHGDFPELRSTQ